MRPAVAAGLSRLCGLSSGFVMRRIGPSCSGSFASISPPGAPSSMSAAWICGVGSANEGRSNMRLNRSERVATPCPSGCCAKLSSGRSAVPDRSRGNAREKASSSHLGGPTRAFVVSFHEHPPIVPAVLLWGTSPECRLSYRAEFDDETAHGPTHNAPRVPVSLSFGFMCFGHDFRLRTCSRDRSRRLDDAYSEPIGLDREAIRAIQEWRFTWIGEAVPVRLWTSASRFADAFFGRRCRTAQTRAEAQASLAFR